jgi:hypothetical protein
LERRGGDPGIRENSGEKCNTIFGIIILNLQGQAQILGHLIPHTSKRSIKQAIITEGQTYQLVGFRWREVGHRSPNRAKHDKGINYRVKVARSGRATLDSNARVIPEPEPLCPRWTRDEHISMAR